MRAARSSKLEEVLLGRSAIGPEDLIVGAHFLLAAAFFGVVVEKETPCCGTGLSVFANTSNGEVVGLRVEGAKNRKEAQ